MGEPLMHKVVGPVFLEEAELARLMEVSDGRTIACEFGPGFVRLKGRNKPVSDWAIPYLAEMRGVGGSPATGLIVFGATE